MSSGVHPDFEVLRVTIPEEPERVVPGITPDFLAVLFMAIERDDASNTKAPIEVVAGSVAVRYFQEYLSGDYPQIIDACANRLPGTWPEIERDALPPNAHIRHYIPKWAPITHDDLDHPVRVCLKEVRSGLSDEQLAEHQPQPAEDDHHNPDQLSFYEDDQAA